MSENGNGMQLVHFRVGRCHLSLEVARVVEVIRLGGIADMKRHMPGVQGAISLHGRVVPVIQLARILDVQGHTPKHAVVARGRRVQLALGVDEVIGVYDRPARTSGVPNVVAVDHNVVREFHRVDRQIIGWMDLEKIFSEHDWEAIKSLSEIETDGLLGNSTLDILGY